MPWKTSDSTQQKARFVRAYLSRDFESFAALCDQFGVSRPTGYDTIERFKDGGLEGLATRSHAPLNCPHSVSATVEKHILGVRKEHPTWGPKKIRPWLERRYPRTTWPALSTIGEVLRRHGLTHPRAPRVRSPRFTQPLAHAVHPNAVWCTDFKGWFHTLDGSKCNPWTLTDASTRMLLRCTHVDRPDYEHVRPLLEAAFREHGLPHAIRSDNGPPFASKALAGLSPLSVWLVHLGIWHERIEPGAPQQNGRHERMHLSLKQDVPIARTLRQQQSAFDRFRTLFNNERPHEALQMATPSSLYVSSPRPYPRVLPELEYPSDLVVRSVRQNGEIRLDGTTLFLSEVLVGERVAVWETEDAYDFYFGPIWLARWDARTKRLLREREATE